jgi:hypothetical protein
MNNSVAVVVVVVVAVKNCFRCKRFSRRIFFSN